jgi:hypothetical protein
LYVQDPNLASVGYEAIFGPDYDRQAYWQYFGDNVP